MFGIVSLSNNIKLGVIGLAFISFTSCKSSSDKGGDCFYNYVDTYAKVIEMKPAADGTIQVILDFDASSLALEDQDLGKLKDMKVDHDFLVRNNIEIGNKYSVTVSEITKGDCTPMFVSFNHSFE
ncbi:MAG: hypothetical protein NWR83_05695 [Salibacteraceae bacterium]|nr:hypothetical protein [Salibacteraceae bacterium]MDP4843934.1 hypothetical protein [Salibacteraceae bacterium]